MSFGMQIDDYPAGILTLVMLAISTGFWIDLIRRGLRDNWSWPLQPRRDVPWKPLEAVAFIVIVLLCISGLIQQAFHLPDTPPFTVRHLQVHGFALMLQMLLTPFVLSLWCSCHWSDFGLRRTGIVEDIRFATWGFLIAQLPVSLLAFPIQALRKSHPHPMLEFLRESASDPYALVWIAISVVVLAPLIEELLFRVLLQGSLERDTPPVVAIVLTAAAFVSTHSAVDWAPLFPLALVLGYVYYRRHSYLSVVVLHALFNAYNLLCALWDLK